MAEIVKRNKALSVSPLKSSSTVGAALAFLGFNRSIPMMHGSQGCTAFGKVFFVRHFREPIPLQTTAMDQIATVMNADSNVVEGLRTICEKSRPALIGLPTTGLSETQGSDVNGAVKDFRRRYPEYDDVAVVPVATPDFTGCLETGWAKALEEMIKILVPDGPQEVPRANGRIIVLAGSALTPGDLEELRDMIELFGLEPIILPDLAGSLDGHLPEGDFSPLTIGGTDLSVFQQLHGSAAVISIGGSMDKAGHLLAERINAPLHALPHLMGMAATDALVMALSEISGKAVPAKLDRKRRQLQDAMMDCHFALGFARYGIAADADLLHGLTDLVRSVGGEVVAAVTPVNTPGLKDLPVDEAKIGDLEELEIRAQANGAQILLGNSHCGPTAERLDLPLLKVGFPQYDLIGGYCRTWIGYGGARQALFDLANMMVNEAHGEVAPYRSIYAQKPEYREGSHGGLATAPEAPARRH